MKQHWYNHGALKDKGKVGTDKPIGKDVDLGGLLVKFDWGKKRVISTKKIACPSGFDFKNHLIYVNSMRENTIYVLDFDFNAYRRIDNQYFNDLHSLNSTNRGTIVTSTGLDTILEVDDAGKILFDWWAIDNGFDRDQYGNQRIINRSIDHTNIDYPTLLQTTHINSAIYMDNNEEDILASLFHQGKILKIDAKTKKACVLLDDLTNPHSIYSLNNGEYIISDTQGHRIILFDIHGQIIKELKGDFNWIQDSIRLSNGNFLVADSNNHKILEIDSSGKIMDSHNYSKNWKIYQIKEVKT